MELSLNIEDLLEYGKVLKTTLKCKDSLGRHKFSNEDDYTYWKYSTLRLIKYRFPNDICNDELYNAFQAFEKHYYNPDKFSQILGILDSCIYIPMILTKEQTKDNHSILINNNINQSQNQAFITIIQTFFDQLSENQKKDILDILNDKSLDYANKKESIFKKLKSFGKDLIASVLANIITNPNIFGIS